jgi:predicted nucleic acid-binding protein
MVLVDSNIWIRANQPKGDLLAKVALESLLEEDEAAVCGPIKLEVLGAMHPQHRARFDLYFSLVPCVGMFDTMWDRAVSLRRLVADNSDLNPTWSDILIASIAIQQRCRVYTLAPDFIALSRVAGIRLYEPGVGGTFNPDYPTTP